MPVCRVCGNEKEDSDFSLIPYFTKYKKHKVTWCKECQKMYIQMKKEKQRIERFVEDKTKFIVSFS